jgi:hypothetical protein
MSAPGSGRVLGPQEFRQYSGNHLPGKAELVLEPAALLRFGIAAGTQLLPVVVDLILSLAIDYE